MAFLNRVSNLLKKSYGKSVVTGLSAGNASIFQSIRWMSSSKLFVGGLSYNTDEMSLREAFAQYGEVIEARVILDRESGRSRGFGFVTYTSTDDASNAIQALDGQDLNGRRVRVNYATERPQRGGFSGGYGGGAGGVYGYGGQGHGGYQGGGYGGGDRYPSVGSGYGGGGDNNANLGAFGGNNFSGGFGGASENPGGFGGQDSLVGGYGNKISSFSGGQTATSDEVQEDGAADDFGDDEAVKDEGDDAHAPNNYANTRS